jgi:hypothetical protein
MSRSNTNVSTLCVSACAFAGLLLGGLGMCKAEGGKSDCWAVYEAALDQEQAGHLRDATVIFRNCAADSCSNPVRQSCQAKLFRLELDAPSVVPLVKDQAGAPVVDAEVTMDGIVFASRLDGRSLTIDPGVHEFGFSVAGRSIGSQRLVIVQGQRNREIWMSLPSTELETAPLVDTAAAPLRAAAATVDASPRTVEVAVAPRVDVIEYKQPSRGGSIMPYVLGGTALAGLGAYLMMSNWARGDNQQLAHCSPNCPADSVTHIRTLYLAADISLGAAAVAALGSAAWFVFSGSSSRSNDKAALGRGFALTVQPAHRGALATFKGTL